MNQMNVKQNLIQLSFSIIAFMTIIKVLWAMYPGPWHLSQLHTQPIRAIIYGWGLSGFAIAAGIGHLILRENIPVRQQQFNALTHMLQKELGVLELSIGIMSLCYSLNDIEALSWAWAIFILFSAINHIRKKTAGPYIWVPGLILSGLIMISNSYSLLLLLTVSIT